MGVGGGCCGRCGGALVDGHFLRDVPAPALWLVASHQCSSRSMTEREGGAGDLDHGRQMTTVDLEVEWGRCMSQGEWEISHWNKNASTVKMGGKKQGFSLSQMIPESHSSAFTFTYKYSSFCAWCLASGLNLPVNIKFNMNYRCTFLTKLASIS